MDISTKAVEAALSELWLNPQSVEKFAEVQETCRALSARVAELEAHMNDALFAIAVNLAFCPEDVDEAQQAVVRAGSVADRLRENLFPDLPGEEREPFAELVARLQSKASPSPTEQTGNPVAEALDKAANEAIQGYVERTDRFAAGFRTGLGKMKDAALSSLTQGGE